MGSTHSTFAAAPSPPGLPASCPVNHAAKDAPTPGSAAPSGLPAACPVNHGKDSPSSSPTGLPAACPVSHEKRGRGTVYNVYAQPIDPTNQMPVTANQKPAPGQREELSVERVQSSIPKGGTEATWLYPSPQMFYNALVRKGKASDVEERDVGMVVAIHNEMNERAWRQLVEWEALHKGEHLDGEPSLRRFMGKPWTPSPKARLKSWLGFGFPFDRHDWFVDRGGREVRYVIDYYYNPDPKVAAPNTPAEAAGSSDAVPSEPRLTRAIHVDVRPAVDDATSFFDRLYLFPRRAAESMRRPWFRAEGLDPAKAPKEAAALNMLHSSNALEPAAAAASDDGASERAWTAVDSKCSGLIERLKVLSQIEGPDSEEEQRRVSVQLRTCVGSVVCPDAASKFLHVMEDAERAGREAGGPEEAAFEALSSCVAARASERRDRLRLSAAGATPGGGASGSGSAGTSPAAPQSELR